MKRILVPTDLSDVAQTGLRLAVEIARRCNAEIYLINFLKHPFSRSFSATGDMSKKVDTAEDLFALDLIRANQSKLSHLALQYSQQGMVVYFKIVDDELPGGMDALLQEYNIDLVVMGTSGEANLKEQFTGNNTEQVISVSSCPVISVRDGFVVQNFQDTVLALDLVDDVNVFAGVQILKDLADCFDSTIHLVHVTDPAIQSGTDLYQYFTSLAKRFLFRKFTVSILAHEDEAEAVLQYAMKLNAGLVAVLKNSSRGIFSVFSNRFSDRMIKETGGPVFTFNLQNA